MVLLQPVQVDQTARMPGGVLAKALPAPAGWERGGLAIPFYGCGEPVLRDKCVTGTDIPNQNGDVASFPAFPIEQGSMCSTTGPDSQITSAQSRFVSTADWAVSRQLQQDLADNGAPKLDDAVSMGAAADANFTLALGCLEQAAADTGFGSAWVVHTTVRGASYLVAQGLVVNGLTPSGAKVIVGSGYENPTGTSVPLWATGPVWASLSDTDVIETVAYQQNNIEAWARGVAVVAFDPCILQLVTVTVPACP